MKQKQLMRFILVAIVASCSVCSTGAQVTKRQSSDAAEQVSARELIAKFGSDDEGERGAARTELLQRCNQSPSFREAALDELSKPANSHVDFPRDTRPDYRRWELVIQTLGDLGGPKAISTLVRELDTNDGGAGLSLYPFPAAMALVRLGPASIEPITRQYTLEEDGLRRDLLIHILYAIGGDEAKAALQRLLTVEHNNSRREDIRMYLRFWEQPSHSRKH